MTIEKTQLPDKIAHLRALLAPFSAPEMEIFPSATTGYRMRAEFRIWHDGEALFYAMNGADKRLQRLTQFPLACPAINALMPVLRAKLQAQPALRHKLFEVDFQATLQGEMMVSLLYHRPLDDDWQRAAEDLAQQLNIHLIGRARKEKRIIGRDFVNETLTVAGEAWHYRQYEGCFSQPNALICQEMIHWAKRQCVAQTGDLLELYCGNGNFTVPLAGHFRRVLATEISKRSIAALRANLLANGVENVAVGRLSAAELTQALRGERVFRRLAEENITLAEYDFATVLVDPPRAGIDGETLALLQNFAQIIYISCHPTTLADNLRSLTTTHDIHAVALFDQFPQTPHIECGVMLRRQIAPPAAENSQ